MCCLNSSVVLIRLNDALLVYYTLAVEQDGLGQTVTPAPPVLDAVSAAIGLQEFCHNVQY